MHNQNANSSHRTKSFINGLLSVCLGFAAVLLSIFTLVSLFIFVLGLLANVSDIDMFFIPLPVCIILCIVLWISVIKRTNTSSKSIKTSHNSNPQSPQLLTNTDNLSENYEQDNMLENEIETESIYDAFDIDFMEGHEFEYYCANLLRKNGFINVEVTPGSGDQGVDILAVKDNIKYAVQCKCFATPLGNKPIQEVHAGKAFYNCHVGVVMTNSTFTPGAIALAQATGTLLWDRTELQKMMTQAKLNENK